MKKLILVLSFLFITNLSALTLGVGAGLENLGNDAYLQIKGDALFPLFSFLDYRLTLLTFNFKDKNIRLGTGIDNDMIAKIPLPVLFQVYIPLGFSFGFNDKTSINLKGGIGLEKEFGLLKGYLEGGLKYFKNDEDKTLFYLQGGVKLSLEIL
ncbi:MAG: hypothetical protein RMJ34_01890 [candidate division WOR-3 bacterium]|nr:hypothetical protein [candidate division WOR-3 bacterium]MDW8113671.1 hypothetical protein [candidate division WOR-3 bacterium]